MSPFGRHLADIVCGALDVRHWGIVLKNSKIAGQTQQSHPATTCACLASLSGSTFSAFQRLLKSGFQPVADRSKRFDELDHSTTLIGIRQRPAHRAGIVRHVARIAGPRDHRSYTRVAE